MQLKNLAKEKNKIKKEYYGKAITHKRKGALYFITDVIYSCMDDTFHLIYNRVKIKSHHSSAFGSLDELVPDKRISFTRTIDSLQQNFTEIRERAEKFRIVREYSENEFTKEIK